MSHRFILLLFSSRFKKVLKVLLVKTELKLFIFQNVSLSDFLSRLAFTYLTNTLVRMEIAEHARVPLEPPKKSNETGRGKN